MATEAPVQTPAPLSGALPQPPSDRSLLRGLTLRRCMRMATTAILGTGCLLGPSNVDAENVPERLEALPEEFDDSQAPGPPQFDPLNVPPIWVTRAESQAQSSYYVTYDEGNGCVWLNQEVVSIRNDLALHSFLADLYHGVYWPKQESKSPDDCPNGWRLCTPGASWDMKVEYTSLSGRDGYWFRMLHTYLWGYQESTLSDHCGDAEGSHIDVYVSSAQPQRLCLDRIKGRDDGSSYTYWNNLRRTSSTHPVFGNHKGSGSHHKTYAFRLTDSVYPRDTAMTFHQAGIHFDTAFMNSPAITCTYPTLGSNKCSGPFTYVSSSVAGPNGPWGNNTNCGENFGCFCGGEIAACSVPGEDKCGWGIGANVRWSVCGDGNCESSESCSSCSSDCGTCLPECWPSGAHCSSIHFHECCSGVCDVEAQQCTGRVQL